MSEAPGFSRERLDALVSQYDEPDWLRDLRLTAFERWQAAPLPDPSHEDWRRTDLSGLDLNRLAALVTPNGNTSAPPAADDAAGRLVFRDGVLIEQRLTADLARQGVILTSLHEALRSHPELVREHFMTRCVQPDEDPFAALHAAFCTGGVFLYVPRGVQIEQPLSTLVELTSGRGSALQHTLVVVEDDAQVQYVEELTGGGAQPVLSAPVVELIAGRGARASFTGVQTWDRGVLEFAHRRAWLDRDAQVTITVGSLGAKLVKSFVGVVMAGEGAKAHLYGFYFPEQGQHFDYTTLQDHRVPHCTSNLLFKGALYDEAQAAFRGVVRVEREAQQTDAYQTNNNLLLGAEARIDTSPVLEILADDVKCSHGATVAHLNQEDLFYLASRGLDRETAARIVIAGFLEPVIDTIPLASLQAKLKDAVQQRIASH